MKFFVLALFVAAVAAKPIDDDSQAVEMIVNGVAEGEALELGHILDIKLKEHVNGAVAASSDLLHPYTAVGLAEAAADAIVPTPIHTIDAPIQPEVPQPNPVIIEEPVVVPSPIVLPEPVLPGPVLPDVIFPVPIVPDVPSPVVLPEPIVPDVPSPVILPEPIAPVVPIIPQPVPNPIILPEPDVQPEPIPEPSAQIPNEIFNDGIVQVQVNGQDAGVLSTLQSWFNMVVNYFNNGSQTSHQIV